MKCSHFIAISGILLFLYAFSSAKNTIKERVYFDKSCNCFVKEFYDEHNRLAMSMQYSDTIYWKKNGVKILFYESGDTSSVTKFVNNYPDGYAYRKDLEGAVISEYFFRNGICDSSKNYNSKQQLASKMYIYREHYNHHSTYYYQPETQLLIYADHYYGTDKPKDEQYELEVFDKELYQKQQDFLANRSGKELFISMCASCHNPVKDATGPKLQGVTNKRSEQWLKSWIVNSSKMIADGDKDAVLLYEQWHKIAMPSYTDLSEQQLNRLLDYLATL